jgi:hypothetical protein
MRWRVWSPGLLPIFAEQRLNPFRAALLVLLALGHDGGTKPGAEVVG